MFSNRIAQAEFASRKAQFEASALQARVKKGSGPGQLPTHQPPATKKAKHKPTPLPSHVSTPSTTDSPKEKGKEVEEEETMFGNLLDEPPTEEITSTGIVISVKDMPISKALSNKVPNNLLMEAINKYDRYATVQYKVVSGASRAVRSSCTIRWTGGRVDQWVMDTVACRDSTQSEQCVATLALHDITFPISVGFAGGPAANASVINYRTLPPAFRDLWNELEASRKLENDTINRSVWSGLQSILRGKLVNKEVGPRFCLSKMSLNGFCGRRCLKPRSRIRALLSVHINRLIPVHRPTCFLSKLSLASITDNLPLLIKPCL
jgi:ATP-dependent RNA helicase DHX29